MNFINSSFFNRVVFPVSLLSSSCLGVFILRDRKSGKKCPSDDRMDGKVVIITGANTGIGKETAKEIAQRGATVVLGCRHMTKCEEAAKEIRQDTGNRHVVCRFLNLANFDSITAFAGRLHKELEHIDVLINNAGVLKPRPPKTTLNTDDGFERQFGVNYLGHFLLTNLLLDKITNGKNPGRIINVVAESCKDGTLDLDDVDKTSLEGEERMNELYIQSKLASLLFTDVLSRLGTNTYNGKLTSNCLNPGVVNTSIGRYSYTPLLSPLHVIKPFKLLLMKTAKQGAQTSIFLATDEERKHSTGGYYDDCEEVAKTCDICDEKLAQLLWSKSKEWTDLDSRLQSILASSSNPKHSTDLTPLNNKLTKLSS